MKSTVNQEGNEVRVQEKVKAADKYLGAISTPGIEGVRTEVHRAATCLQSHSS